jgi:GntR family transcriptional repressor for pyruvate dehydrogenase complex
MTLFDPSDTPSVALRRPRNLAQMLVDDLSGQILNRQLAVGDKLPTETEIMAVYGVSRAVVRESITRLQAARLVETRHGIGTFVLPPPEPGVRALDPGSVVTLNDVLDVLELRVSVETEAASLAAQRRSDAQLDAIHVALDRLHGRAEGKPSADADAEFHLGIAAAANNTNFLNILRHLRNNIIPRARLDLAKLTPDDLARVAQEHMDIYTAIRNQDPETARAAMRSHLSNSRERLLRVTRAT